MSANHRTLELKKAHIALISGLIVKPEKLSLIDARSKNSPFSEDGILIDDLANLIVGKEPSDKEKKQMIEEGKHFYTRDNEEELLTIYSELQTALEIVLNTRKFEPGKYRTRVYEISWKKIK